MLERTYGTGEGFALHAGALDDEEAVFAEFTLDGLPLEVAAQREHVHRRLGAATLGIVACSKRRASRPAATGWGRIAAGDDWLEAAVDQTGLSRTAIESLATANRAVAGACSASAPAPPLRDYVVPLFVGFVSPALIVAATARRGSSDFTGAMLLFESVVLGAVFGARMGLAAALAPLAVFGACDRGQHAGRQRRAAGATAAGCIRRLRVRRRPGRERGRRGGAAARPLLPPFDARRQRLISAGRLRSEPPATAAAYVRDWTALREARERRGCPSSQVEDDTEIRARYIRALEEEAFGILPGATYTKGFLRAYADYLGLDGHLFIDEFNSRYHDPRNDDDRAIYPKSNSRPRGRQRRETNIVLIVLAAIVAIASLVFLGFNFSGPANVNLPPPPSTPTTSTAPNPDTTSHTGTTEKTHTHHPHNPGQVPDRDYRRQRQLVALRPPWVRRRPSRYVGARHRSLAVPAAAGRGGCTPGQRAGRGHARRARQRDGDDRGPRPAASARHPVYDPRTGIKRA